MATPTQPTTGGENPGTLETTLRQLEAHLDNAKHTGKASSDGQALLKKAIAETGQLVDAYGRAFEGYSTNLRELKSLHKQQATLLKGLSEQGKQSEEVSKGYDDSVEEIRKHVEELENRISTATTESTSLVRPRDKAAEELNQLKTQQKKIDQNLKSMKAIREDAAAKEIKGEYTQVQFLLKRYEELVGETEKLLIPKSDFESKLRAAWMKLYEANKKIQDLQSAIGTDQAELKRAKEDLKQRQEGRDKTILEDLKGSNA